MKADVLLGLQWGDEGKGKIVDYLSRNYDLVLRFQGGPNAGHTLYVNGNKYVLHTVPSGIFIPHTKNLIGNGVVIDPVTLMKEIKMLEGAGVDVTDRLMIARKAHLILPTHKILDAASEKAKGKKKIGSTLKGIGPTYMDKTGRNGLRVGNIESTEFSTLYNNLKEKHIHLLQLYDFEYSLDALESEWLDAISYLKRFRFVDGEYYVHEALAEGKKVLAEGAQGSMLDIDFGTYPFVTSSNTITAGVCTGSGINPSQIGEVIGISKAYCTRVGSGPFPSEEDNETGARIREIGHEFGATTGRERRCGWIDLVALKYCLMINGVTQLVITKVDVLNDFEEIKAAVAYKVNGVVTNKMPFDIHHAKVEPVYKTFPGWKCSLEGVESYDQLPGTLRSYIAFLEKELSVKVSMISSGPGREELIPASEKDISLSVP